MFIHIDLYLSTKINSLYSPLVMCAPCVQPQRATRLGHNIDTNLGLTPIHIDTDTSIHI